MACACRYLNVCIDRDCTCICHAEEIHKRSIVDSGQGDHLISGASPDGRRTGIAQDMPSALTKRSGAGWDVAVPMPIRTNSTHNSTKAAGVAQPSTLRFDASKENQGNIARLDYPGWELACEHPNEVPAVCPCRPSCGCRVRHCSKPRPCPSPGLLELGKRNIEAIAREDQLKTSAFTKMHFEVVAEVLRLNHAPTEIAEAFADTFAKYNPNFNRHRFLGAATGAV